MYGYDYKLYNTIMLHKPYCKYLNLHIVYLDNENIIFI